MAMSAAEQEREITFLDQHLQICEQSIIRSTYQQSNLKNNIGLKFYLPGQDLARLTN